MSLTIDREDGRLKNNYNVGQNEVYLDLPDEELEQDYTRPYRDRYIHVGIKPTYSLRELDEEQKQRYSNYGYIKFEEYPENESPVTGKFWTEDELNSGCGTETIMGEKLFATYARNLKLYSSAFCVKCNKHFLVNEFRWSVDNEIVGS